MSLALKDVGKIVVMMGNQAIARGAIEAGIRVAAAYPGTPSTEILESLVSVSSEFGIHVEWSTNEMVALEVAAGAAILGLRAMASMKHVGLNWAADPLMVINQTGVEGGLLIVSADDPGGHSSQNEQDNRNYGRFAEILTLEPASVDEAKEMAKKAFDLSEEVKLPVLLRTVTRISHARGTVTLGDIKKVSRKPFFKDDAPRWICRGIYTVAHHKVLHEKNRKIKEIVETLPFNRLVPAESSSKLGIIASGIGYAFTKEALKILNLGNKVDILKIGTPYPLPESLVKIILKNNNKVLVIEEGSPFIENEIRAFAFAMNGKPEIYGRLTKNIPEEGEINADIVAKAIADILGINMTDPPERLKVNTEVREKIPRRTLVLCAGCPHRATLYALKQTLKTTGNEEKVLIAADIGCYGSGSATPPFNISDILLCMGGGIGVANGFSAAKWEGPIVALIGDSTFMHAGIPALINAVYNKHKFVLVVMDNRTTAMTGMQDHPGTGITATGDRSREVKIEEIAKAVGVEYVKVVDPFNLEVTMNALKEALYYDGVSVIIARRPCMLMRIREIRRKGITMKPYVVNEEKCDGCRVCITEFACPAFRWSKNGIVKISASDCASCGFCRYVCPKGAITLRKNWGGGIY